MKKNKSAGHIIIHTYRDTQVWRERKRIQIILIIPKQELDKMTDLEAHPPSVQLNTPKPRCNVVHNQPRDRYSSHTGNAQPTSEGVSASFIVRHTLFF